MRGLACLLLILGATLLGVPNLHSGYSGLQVPVTPHNTSLPSTDPPVNASLTAFNYTEAQGDLYTKSSPLPPTINPVPNATTPPYNGTRFFWLNTVTRTTTGNSIVGSAFRFNITTPKLAAPPSPQIVNWTLTVPRASCPNCVKTEVDFNFFGNLTKGTSANYTLTLAPFNGTVIRPVSLAGALPPNNFTAPGSFPNFKILSCPEVFCIDVTKYVGLNLTLSFRFGWNGTETGMSVDVGEIAVASRGTTNVQSTSNYMMLNSTDTTKVTHFTNLSKVNYNSTVAYKNPKTGNTVTHIWSMEILNIYYAFGYTINQIILNSSTPMFPVSPRLPFENCNSPADCSPATIALNMSDLVPLLLHNSTVTIRATTQNTISLLTTIISGVPVLFYAPGDNVTVKAINVPSANVPAFSQTGRLNITLFDPNGSTKTIPSQAFSTIAGGNFAFGPIPTTGPPGIWNVNATFVSGFDLGVKLSSFRVDQMQLGSFNVGGGNNALNVQGKLTYANNSAAGGVNGVVFAVDAGTPTNKPITSQTSSPSSTSLYIANATLINGVFTQGQPLIMTFTVINPTSQNFFANVTIEHEWPTSQTHMVKVTFPLTFGDQPFNTQVSKVYPYEADVSLTSNGVQVKVTSLSTLNSKTVTMSPGTTPIVPTRQHTGLFKVTITGAVLGTSTPSSNSLESPPYAYVLAGSLVPSKYLASTPLTSNSTGSFSLTLTSNAILGARKLVLFALARDTNGIVLWNKIQDPTGATDNTLIQSTLDPIGQVAVKQTVQASLHLTNNATKITMTITVNLNLQGNGVVDTRTVTIAPGTRQPVTFTFTAPQSPGSYALTFSSLQYGGPFATQTLQVVILQSNLQILIPAAIGLVAALIILGFYLIRGRPEKETEKEEKPKSTGPKPRSQPGQSPSTSKSLTRS